MVAARGKADSMFSASPNSQQYFSPIRVRIFVPREPQRRPDLGDNVGIVLIIMGRGPPGCRSHLFRPFCGNDVQPARLARPSGVGPPWAKSRSSIVEPSEDILQMSIGIDGSDELVIMIMQESLQRIGLQHKRVGTPSHHVE